MDNVRVVRRPNVCFDLGAFGEVLRDGDLWRRYRRFITLNASIRGPFVPSWSDKCWSDAYLDRVTDDVKVRAASPLPLLNFPARSSKLSERATDSLPLDWERT